MKLTIINSIRTNNFKDAEVMEKITDLWKSIPTDLTKRSVYGVYHEYEADYKGDYRLSVAVAGEAAPTITIPSDGKYEIFQVGTNGEQGVFNTWSKIWNAEKEGHLQRAYTYDFEKYDPDGTIEIHIAISDDAVKNEIHPV